MKKSDFAALAEKVVRLSAANDVTVRLSHKEENTTRFAESRITQNMSRKVTRLTVKVAFGSTTGISDTTDLTEEGVREAVRRAEGMAKHAHEDPEYVPPLGPQEYPEVPNRFYPETAEASPDLRAEAVKSMVSEAFKAGMSAAGRLVTGQELLGWATNKGLFAFHPHSFAEGVMTAMAGDSSGYAHQASENLPDISPAMIAQTAVRKAEMGQNPIELKPNYYTVILEPLALADLLVYMLYLMDARSADEGRSFFTGKLGQRIFTERLTLVSDPTDPTNPAVPFLEDGVPASPLVIAEEGVLQSLFYDLVWAAQKGVQPTGRRRFCTFSGGRGTASDLLKGVERGILITRFWYVRYVDPMQVLVTGMTRDGTYLVENGKIVKAVKNLRFNDSPVRALLAAKGMGEPVRTYMGFRVPPVVVEEFNFTSGTLF
jgi:predicted Zn-dependent protease